MTDKMNRTRLTSAQHSQRGAGLFTTLIFLALLGLAALTAVKLVPVYMEYSTVKKELQTVAESLGNKKASPREVWRRLAKRLDVNNINDISEQDLIVETVDGERRMRIEYEVIRPFLGNIDFLVTFKAEVD